MGSRKRKAPGSSTAAATATTSEGAYEDPGGSAEVNEEPSETPLSPVAKKGRTNTPWTPAEERRLKSMRDAGSSWNEIAKVGNTFDPRGLQSHTADDRCYRHFLQEQKAVSRNIGTR